jgi:hypothetical protein
MIVLKLFAYQRGKTVGAAAEIQRLGRHQHPHPGRHGNHVAARAARSTAAKVAGSIPAGNRTVAMPIVISIVAGCSARAVVLDGAASTITGAKAEPFALASSVTRRATRRQPNSLLRGQGVR